MTFAISIDWSEEFKRDCDKWINHGKRVLNESCNHKHGDEKMIDYQGWCDVCDIREDSAEPMMNFIYPLETVLEDSNILEIVIRTNCTVMENTESGEFFLALCGGGMDLSQDIALAYILAEKWIPEALITQVCKQKELSIYGEDFKLLKKEIIEQAKVYAERFRVVAQQWGSKK
jgi:hypothetical protein